MAHARRHFPTNWRFYAIDAQDLSRGIIIVWHNEVATINVFHRCTQHVSMVIIEIHNIEIEGLCGKRWLASLIRGFLW